MSQTRIKIRGRELNVSLSGQGPALLLVHGFPLDHRMWRYQIEYFSQSHYVIAPDLSGFGASDVDDREIVTMKDYADELAELIRNLNIRDNLTFCGLSMGGYLGWQLLKSHGNLINQIVMTNTRSAADDERTARGRRILASQVLTHGVSEIVSHMPLRLLGKNSKHLEQEIRDVISTTDRRSIAAGHLGMADRPDMSDFLHSIKQPTLVVCGNEDQITPPREMKSMAERIPFAEYMEIENAGHMTPLEAPLEFNQAVETFLKTNR